ASGVFDHRPQFMTRIRINDKGLRGKDYPYERVAGKRRVLVLGDSLVFGYGVEQDEVFTDVLEGMLPATEVINAGVSGYGTDQELLWFRSEGVRYRPDLVIILMTGNDEWENHESLVYWFYPKPHFTLSDRGELRLTNVPVAPPPAGVHDPRHRRRQGVCAGRNDHQGRGPLERPGPSIRRAPHRARDPRGTAVMAGADDA